MTQNSTLSLEDSHALSHVIRERNINNAAEAIIGSKQLFHVLYKKILQQTVADVGMLRARKYNVSHCVSA